jgi:hypothetical protein
MKTKSILSLTLVSLLSATSALADGGGIHGPDQDPQSMTVGVDHGVNPEIVPTVSNICLVRGSEEDGIESLLQKLGRQVFPKVSYEKQGKLERGDITFQSQNTPVTTGNYAEYDLGYDPEIDVVSRSAEPKNLYLVHDRRFSVLRSSPYDLTGMFERPEFFLNESAYYQAPTNLLAHLGFTDGQSRRREIRLVLPEGYTLPHIVGDRETIMGPGYMDEYRQKHGYPESVVLTNARIEWKGALEVVNLVSPEDPDKMPTPATVDLKAYAECLKSEFQKAAALDRAKR